MAMKDGRVKDEKKVKVAEKKNEKAEKPAEPATEKRQDHWSILMYPHLAEKSMKAVEAENKLVFIVDKRANKDMIASAVEKEFSVTVTKVTTEITQAGLKKAYIKLSDKHSAGDIATRLGMV